jgi:hypothetical protein
MMNRIASVMVMHARDRLTWFIAPWFLQLTAFSVTLVLGLLRHGYGTGFSSGGAGDIYIFFGVMGILSVNDTFPFALSFNVRRKDYFLGTLLLALGLSAATALALASLGFIESHVVHGWGVGIHFFAPPYLSAGSFPQQAWVDFSLLLDLFSLGFVISSIYRRFGRVGLWIFFAVVLLLLTTWIGLNIHLNSWGAFFAWFAQHTAFELALRLLPLMVLSLLASYLLLRRAVV